MNEQAINQVIADYAVENANLRIRVATLQDELNKIKADQEAKKEEEK